MLIIANNRTGNGTQYTLTNTQDLKVNAGITVKSQLNYGVTGSGFDQRIQVSGLIQGYLEAVYLTGDDAHVSVSATGRIRSTTGAGIFLGGEDGNIQNAGLIAGKYGVVLQASSGTALINNAGTIRGSETAIIVTGSERIRLVNEGTIESTDVIAYVGSIGTDIVINKGEIIGNISLQGGNDVFDGREGRATGKIFGGDGVDVFKPGAGHEKFDGGGELDAVDFTNMKQGVSMALDGAFANTGRAKGDIYSSFELFFGSESGGDRMRGNNDANNFFGAGGNDTLNGAGGVDNLYGGAGSDVLVTGDGVDTVYGGAGADRIDLRGDSSAAVDALVFYNLGERGDKVQGFAPEDVLYVSASAFKGGFSAGPINPDIFKSGGNNRAADADDRFIFRQGDATLWYDRDGTKMKFAPVLLIDFADGTDFLSTNLFGL